MVEAVKKEIGMNKTIKERIEQIRQGIVPKGYKEAKVGIVPDDWTIKVLKNIAEKVVKKNVENKYNLVFSNSAKDGIVIQTDYFDKEIANRANLSNYYVVKNNDFVYNPRISSMAPYGPINRNDSKNTGLVSPLYRIFRMRNDDCNVDFMEYYFHSSLWNKHMYSVANTGARHDRMNITDKDFFNLKISLPNYDEQQIIADILATWDRAIELKESLIKEKEEQKKGLVQKLLTSEIRLQGYTEEWKEWKLGQLGKFLRGRGIARRDIKKRGVNCILYGEIYTRHHFYIKKFHSFIDQKTADKSTELQKNDILFTSSGETAEEIGKAVAYLDNNEAYAGGDIIIFRPQKELDSLFLSYLVNTGDVAKRITRLGQGHSVVHIYPSLLTDLSIKLPSLKEQKRISSILKKMDNNITLLKKEKDNIKEQKKGLMQLLLTGIVRVGEVDQLE